MGLETMQLNSQDEFRSWLARDHEVRDELESMVGAPLDAEAPSLDTVEGFLLGRFRTPVSALAPDQRGVVDAASRHIGLVMVRTIDEAGWAIDLDNEDNANYRLPIILMADGAQACPLTLATAALDRRTGTFLRTVVEGYQADYNVETPA